MSSNYSVNILIEIRLIIGVGGNACRFADEVKRMYDF